MSKDRPEEKSTKSESTDLPKGVVLGPDGKPCRTCTSAASWKSLTKLSKIPTTTTPSLPKSTPESVVPPDCPPDVEALGRNTWTLLHSITASYPTHPSPSQQSNALTFISSFSNLYPCWSCATDFREWLTKAQNAPRVSSREDFGRWMCEAHNAVNEKLGKQSFDCGRWEERWRTGWRDGRCD